jgi:WD40 repeat protein
MPEEPKRPADLTEVQTSESIAASKDLSVPQGVSQDAAAPKIAGYVLTRALGQGAFAQVWEAWQIRTRRTVAVKVFSQKKGVNWVFLQREVERLIRLDKNPNIVSLLDADLAGDPAYYVMDQLTGGSLDPYADGSRPATVLQAVRWMEEICAALAFVHAKGLIHCDLKPANILLDEAGHVRVADFGQSRVVTESSGALGTLFYMAPEQAILATDRAQLQPDVRWDVYALGATMYAVLTGSVPHASDENRSRLQSAAGLEERLKTYREIAGGAALKSCAEITRGLVDADLSAIVGKCMEVDEHKRYQSVQEILADLRARRKKRPVSPLAHDRRYVARKYVLRNAPLLAVAAVAAAFLTGAFVQILVERRALKRQLAYSYVLRAHQLAEGGSDATAALYFLEANKVWPSADALRNALSHVHNLRLPRLVIENRGTINALEFSPDGKTVLTAGYRKAVRLWDAKTGAQVGAPLEHPDVVAAAAFSPDGAKILTGCRDGSLRLWDVASGKLIGAPQALTGSVSAVAFSPDGKRVVAADSGSNSAQVRDAATWAPVGAPMKHDDVVSVASFSPDGRLVMTASYDASVRFWDARTGRPSGAPLLHGNSVFDARFSPDGKKVVTGSRDKFVRVWDVAKRTMISDVIRHQDSVLSVAFSPDGARIISGGYDKSARVWDAVTGNPAGPLLRNQGGIKKVAFSPDGLSALTGGYARVSFVWDAAPVPGNLLLNHPEQVWSVAYSPDGSEVATGGKDHAARLWDAKTGARIGKELKHERGVAAVAFSPDGKYLLTGSADKTARLWDARTGEPAGTVIHETSGIDAVGFTPDGARFFTACHDSKTVRFWDARTGASVGKPFAHQSWVAGAKISPDGRTLLSASADGGARLWDVESGEVKRTIMAPGEDRMRSVAFSPDGKRVLTGSANGVAAIWDAATGAEIGKPMIHDGGVYGVAFSPDGRFVLTACFDGTARLWDAETGEPLGRSLRHANAVYSAVFSPDGSKVLTGSQDMTARVWDTSWLAEDLHQKRMKLRTEVVSDERINSEGELESIGLDEWLKMYKRATDGSNP